MPDGRSGQRAAVSSHPHQRAARGLPVTLIVILGFAGVEALAGWLAGSLVILASAAYTVALGFTLALATLRARVALLPASHPEQAGLRRLELVTGLANGLLLLVLTGLLVWQATQRLLDPQPVMGEVVILVAGAGIVLHALTARLIARTTLTHATPLTTLLHALHAPLGAVLALIAGLGIQLIDRPTLDPLVALVVCGLLLAAAVRIMQNSAHPHSHTAAPPALSHDVEERMAAMPGVAAVHALHVWEPEPQRLMLAAHIQLLPRAKWRDVLAELHHLLQDEYGIEHAILQPEASSHKIIPVHAAASSASTSHP